MENLKEFVKKHKIISYIFGLGFIVFINCFGFPFYNFNNEFSNSFNISYIIITLVSAWNVGMIWHGLFPKKNIIYIIFITILFSALGLICRYFLEFGEVSNEYNFTILNVIVHLGIFIFLAFLNWIYLSKKYYKDIQF